MSNEIKIKMARPPLSDLSPSTRGIGNPAGEVRGLFAAVQLLPTRRMSVSRRINTAATARMSRVTRVDLWSRAHEPVRQRRLIATRGFDDYNGNQSQFASWSAVAVTPGHETERNGRRK